MAFRRDPESGRQAVLWLATGFVILIGGGACAFIVVAAVEDPSQHLMLVGVIFAVLLLLIMRMAMSGDRSGGSWMQLWMAMRGKSDPKTVIRIGRKKNAGQQFGNNAPPTLESVRDAAEQNVSWVPHGPPPDRSRPR